MSIAHRCRTCRQAHYGDRAIHSYPPPAAIAALQPHMITLLQAATEFVSYGSGTPLEFVEWLSIDTARSAEISEKLAARA